MLKFHYLCGRITNRTHRGGEGTGVVICSNFTTFAVESPIVSLGTTEELRCDLLKFHYLCGRITNLQLPNVDIQHVVICSNFTTFAVESPMSREAEHEAMGCDLLKFHYLCGRITN